MSAGPKPVYGACCTRFKPGISVEPIMASIFFALSLAGAPLTDLVMRQACREYGLDRDNCTADKDIDIAVQRITSNFSMYRLIIATLPGGIMSLFYGPWSDTNGRKPIMILGLLGTGLDFGILAYFSTIDNISPNWMLLAAAPAAVTGGMTLIMIGSSCYIIDITTPEQRPVRLSIAMASASMATILGNAAAPILADAGYIFVFGTSSAILFAACLYASFLLPESINVPKEKRTRFLTTDHIKDTYKIYTKKRPNHARGILYALTVQLWVTLFAGTGEMDVRYQTLIEKFNWTLEDYSMFNVVILVAQAFGTASGVFIGINLIGLKDLTLCILVESLSCVLSFATAVTTSATAFYIISVANLFKTCALPLSKSIASGTVPANEVGKVMAFIGTVESFTPQLSSLAYTTFFNLTVATNPFMVYFLTFGLMIISVMSLLTVGLLQRSARNSEKEKEISE
ncbi:Major Facilitator Superfamily [Nesidiocoris tenuis]|uniref:Major Facilitator Superfamily n=1 Tax=Nesidiocoris tenuis TaxID=355587 RepID=A0ABN7AWR2_9HEMI|nr:Major Facilitator Superfamily [Nesidiocoris tenuis]